LSALPSPRAIRLVGAEEARAPFGLSFSSEADALCVVLHNAENVAAVAAQIPDGLAPDALVIVMPHEARAAGLLAKLRPARQIPRDLRCSALLARGFVRIGAASDPKSGADLVWGYVAA
jgi:hypothetical protein